MAAQILPSTCAGGDSVDLDNNFVVPFLFSFTSLPLICFYWLCVVLCISILFLCLSSPGQSPSEPLSSLDVRRPSSVTFSNVNIPL